MTPLGTVEPTGLFRATRESGGFSGQEPDPTPVSTVAELIEALNEVHVWAGTPSLRRIEHESQRRYQYIQSARDQVEAPLSRSSVSEMLRWPKLPPLDRYLTFLKICKIRNVAPWRFTWQRLKMIERQERLGA
ncbi:hypothetical protein [Streptomyces mirabilis]|uniref:hypothetical protein n=1 Tax=Streptomyces mirabilis TaxID=68239 RepID=UPI0033A9A17B